MNVKIGKDLKRIRKEKRITLTVLAERTGLSTGFLSNIERDLASPTLDNVESIMVALGIHSLTQLIRESPGNEIVRRRERTEFYNIPGRVVWTYLTDENKPLCGVCTTITPGNDVGASWGHGYDEVCVVISGSITLTIDGREYLLEEGDTAYIPKEAQHAARNTGGEACVCYWFSYNPKT